MLDTVSDSGPVPADPPPGETAAIARIFADVFELETVGPNDDFFALGGDSLLASAIVNEIERTSGASLSVSALMEAPTPEKLAALVGRTRESNFSRILVPVRPDGSGPCIFSVHGMEGDDLYTNRFADGLAQDRPIWAIRAIGLQAGEQPMTSVEAMADLYAAAIRSVQPQGPYILMGHCGLGVMTVWEMAQRLMAAGATIAGVILMEPASAEKWAPYLHKSGMALEVERSRALKTAAAETAWLDANNDATGEPRRQHMKALMTAITAAYMPETLACPALIICRTERQHVYLKPDSFHRKLIRDCQIFVVTGGHRELLKERLPDSLPTIRAFLNRIAPLA